MKKNKTSAFILSILLAFGPVMINASTGLPNDSVVSILRTVDCILELDPILDSDPTPSNPVQRIYDGIIGITKRIKLSGNRTSSTSSVVGVFQKSIHSILRNTSFDNNFKLEISEIPKELDEYVEKRTDYNIDKPITFSISKIITSTSIVSVNTMVVSIQPVLVRREKNYAEIKGRLNVTASPGGLARGRFIIKLSP